MTIEQIRAADPSDMYTLIKTFPQQVEEAIAIGTASKIKLSTRGIENIVMCGMGGSAIGGDLLRSYLADEMRVPFTVNRNYTLPKFVGRKSLVIISSYSGNTEETNACHKEAIQRGATILCITSGGLVEKIATQKKQPCIIVPGGPSPRAALGYSFFPLLLALAKLKLIKNKEKEIRETLALLRLKSDEYSDPDLATNQALLLAQQLQGRIGVVYSATERLDAINTRWRGQMAENGKSLMWGHVLPEMNHNELVGWRSLREQVKEMQVIFLRDKDDHKRVQHRLDITKQIVSEYTQHITEVWSEGKSPLARMFSLIHLGDWVSFYLAIVHEVDPMPVAVIDYLKEELSQL
jgi:glucose/mannose-6-phosphate isomerase